MHISDEILIQKIQGGDRAAFEILFRNFYALLCNYANTFVKNPHVAEDQVQEVFVNIWEQKEDWHPKGTIKSYLYTAVKHQSLNYLKHKQVVEEWKQEKAASSTVNIDPPADKRIDPGEIKKWIQAAISQLPKKRRDIYKLSRDHGLTYVEISKVLNISIKTVETQMGRSLRHLRKVIREKML